MAVDITNISRMVFGVNYLGANGSADVDALWNGRFTAKEAYLLSAEPQEHPKAIFLRFQQMLQERGKTEMAKERCILVFFVDYTTELHENTRAALWNLKNGFINVLDCHIETVIQFAYVGEKGLDETAVQRASIQKALEKNNEKQVHENYRLFLVGKTALQGKSSSYWKSSIVYLDLLRRCQDLQNYLPATNGNLGRNDICFLRYGEYNHKAYEKLVHEQKRLQTLLSTNNSSKLRMLVEGKRNEIVNFIEAQYDVDGAQHPQHPDMIVEAPKGWFSKDKREAAKKDKNPEYAHAQKKTRAAVELTGEWLRKEIEAWFEEQIADAENTLQQFFEEADVGIKLKLNPVEMKSVLYLPPYPDPGVMPSLTLRYSEQGAAGEIGAYLTCIRNHCICSGLKKYTAALQDAFDAIPQEDIRIQQRELERKRDRATQELADAMDVAEFCKSVALMNPTESIFEINTEMNVRNAKFLLCRNAYLPIAEKMAVLGNIVVHGVDDPMCGIASFDDAPVKAVMIESVECRDWVLEQLLPEVDYGL